MNVRKLQPCLLASKALACTDLSSNRLGGRQDVVLNQTAEGCSPGILSICAISSHCLSVLPCLRILALHPFFEYATCYIVLSILLFFVRELDETYAIILSTSRNESSSGLRLIWDVQPWSLVGDLIVAS